MAPVFSSFENSGITHINFGDWIRTHDGGRGQYHWINSARVPMTQIILVLLMPQ